MKLLARKEIFDRGYVEYYRVTPTSTQELISDVTTIANVCRGDSGVSNPEKLYNHLLKEHNGKPGEAFQFIPAVANNINLRFAYKDKDCYYTNARELIENNIKLKTIVDPKMKDFHVFKIKVPMMIVPQMLRHGCLSFMQISERTNKLREYYWPDEFLKVGRITPVNRNPNSYDALIDLQSQNNFDSFSRNYNIRQELTNKGSHGLAYVTLWIAGWKNDPTQWDNFFAVRLNPPAQKEMRVIAKVIKDLMENSYE